MVRRLFAELFVLFGVAGAILLALNWFYSDYKTPIDLTFESIDTANPSVQTLLSGNSHMGAMTHNLYIDTNAVNVSMGGQDVFHQLLIAEYAMGKMPALKTIVMNLDPEMLGTSLAYSNQEYIDRQYYPHTHLLYDNTFGNRLISSSAFFRSNRDLNYLFQHKRMEQEFKSVGRKANFLPNEKPSPELCKKRAIELTSVKFKKPLVDESLKKLHEIIVLAKEKSISLVLITTPRRPCYMSYADTGNMNYAIRRLQTFLTTENVPLYNYYDAPGFDDSDFRDPDHMNDNGERKLADRLLPAIKNQPGK